MQSRILRRHVAVPQDHGSWVFILSPLLIGLFAGGRYDSASASLIVAAMAAFMLRQPAALLVKILTGHRSRDELAVVGFWVGAYLLICLSAVAALVLAGFTYVTYLAIPGALIFGWYLFLVSRRDERKQAGMEIMATGALSLAAPAAYWVGIGRYDPTGWWLWILIWMQSAASIVYAYLRLKQRSLDDPPANREKWAMGRSAASYTTFNLLASLALGAGSVLPRLIFLPYLLQWIETIWGIHRPAIRWRPTRIGIRQLIVSALWTILFILVWR